MKPVLPTLPTKQLEARLRYISELVAAKLITVEAALLLMERIRHRRRNADGGRDG